MTPRVIFDGANIAFPQGSSREPDLYRYASVVLGVCFRLGVAPETETVTIFDCSFYNRLDARQRRQFALIQKKWGQDRVSVCPSAQRADEWILDLARSTDAVVVSEDLYREHPNRQGAVRVPHLLSAGIVVLRTGYLLREKAEEDIEVPLEEIFPEFTKRKFAVPDPGPHPLEISAPAVELATRRLGEAARAVLGEREGREMEFSLLVKAMREELGSVEFDRACGELAPGERGGRALQALRALPGLSFSGGPTTRWLVRLTLSSPVEPPAKPPSEPAPRPPSTSAGELVATAALQEEFVRQLYTSVAEAPDSRMLVARLAGALAEAYPGERFSAICQSIAPGSAHRRFLRLLRRLDELETFRAENGEWMVALRKGGASPSSAPLEGGQRT